MSHSNISAENRLLAHDFIDCKNCSICFIWPEGLSYDNFTCTETLFGHEYWIYQPHVVFISFPVPETIIVFQLPDQYDSAWCKIWFMFAPSWQQFYDFQIWKLFRKCGPFLWKMILENLMLNIPHCVWLVWFSPLLTVTRKIWKSMKRLFGDGKS